MIEHMHVVHSLLYLRLYSTSAEGLSDNIIILDKSVHANFSNSVNLSTDIKNLLCIVQV